MNLPRQCKTSPAQLRHTSGGNSARVHSRAASLFEQELSQFLAQIGTADPSLREGSRAGAAHKGIVWFAVNRAKSLPLEFLKVNYLTHRGAPIFVDETKFNRSAFA